MSRLRQGAQEYGYYGYGNDASLWVRAPTDAVSAAVGLDSRGQPVRYNHHYQAVEEPIVIDDVAAHYLLLGGDTSPVLGPRLAQQLVQGSPQGSNSARSRARPLPPAPVLEGWRAWIRQHISQHVPKAPSLDAATPPVDNVRHHVGVLGEIDE
jgi:hypothetical protein